MSQLKKVLNSWRSSSRSALQYCNLNAIFIKSFGHLLAEATAQLCSQSPRRGAALVNFIRQMCRLRERVQESQLGPCRRGTFGAVFWPTHHYPTYTSILGNTLPFPSPPYPPNKKSTFLAFPPSHFSGKVSPARMTKASPKRTFFPSLWQSKSNSLSHFFFI